VLYDSYPLLSEPGPGPMRTQVNQARIGHNHWALQRIIGDLNDHAGRYRLQDLVSDMREGGSK
jgi:hypothetical protein